MLDQDARCTVTTLNRGSRSTWMFKIKPSGQVESARRSATVFAITEIPCSTSTLMLSRQLKRCFRTSSIVRAGYRSKAFSPSKQSGAHQEACYGRNSSGSLAMFTANAPRFILAEQFGCTFFTLPRPKPTLWVTLGAHNRNI